MACLITTAIAADANGGNGAEIIPIMAANNNLNPEWQPTPFAGEDPGLWVWRKLSTQYIYQLRGQIANLNTSVQDFISATTVAPLAPAISAVEGNGALVAVSVNTSPYSVLVANQILVFVSGSGTVNLPQATTITRNVIYMYNASSGNITLTPYSGDTIGGQSSWTITPGAFYQFVPNA